MNLPSTPVTLSDLRLLDFTTLIKTKFIVGRLRIQKWHFVLLLFNVKEIHAVFNINMANLFRLDFLWSTNIKLEMRRSIEFWLLLLLLIQSTIASSITRRHKERSKIQLQFL